MNKKDTKGRKLYENEDQMKDGRYRYRYTDKYGERKAVYSWRLVTTDKTPKGKKDSPSLREKIKQIQKDLDEDIDISQAEMSVNDLLKKYLSTKVGLAVSTYENYKYMWEKDIKPNRLGKMKICDVKKSDILHLYAYFHKDRKFTNGTIQMYQNLLYPAFQMAVDDSIIRLNPCRNCMKDYTQGSMSTTRIALTQSEQDKLLHYLKHESARYNRYYLIISLLLGTGLRISEAIGLTWDDIDFDERVIRVTRQALYRRNGNLTQMYVSQPKTKKARIIPLNQTLYNDLKQYKAERYFFSLTAGPVLDGHAGFVFFNSRGHLHKPATLVRAFHHIRAEYNQVETERAIEEHREPVLMPDFSPHVLRHSFCTRMAENGMDVKVLQSIMGHANIQVTMEVYNHVNEDRIQKEMSRVEEKMNLAQ